MVNDQQASNWWIGAAHAEKKKNAIRQVQLSFPIETRTFKYPMHIYKYFDDIFQESRKQSHFTQSKPS